MKTKDFFYELPEELIAQSPLPDRSSSRLMLLDKKTGEVGHSVFFRLPEYLRAGDCLGLNDSRVLPARLIGRRATGGAVEVLLPEFRVAALVPMLISSAVATVVSP